MHYYEAPSEELTNLSSPITNLWFPFRKLSPHRRGHDGDASGTFSKVEQSSTFFISTGTSAT